ncbi:rhodanese-like domain-containing protein [Candidatus Pacearchaeota archaeon]|nr:rhodanese-like domain-containing protein [Candidatus Pacearchaeota archaeon]
MRKKHVEISFVTLALIIIILAISFLPFGKCQNCDIEETNLKIINVKDWLDLSRSEGVIFLDIRTQEEFEKFHLDGAINLDFYNESYREDLDKLDKSRTYLTYCRSGRRSGLNLEIMKELGLKSAYDLDGGILAYNKFIDNQKP